MIEKYITEESLELCKTCMFYETNTDGVCDICTGDEYRKKRNKEETDNE